MKNVFETLLTRNKRGLLAVFGAFLLQLCAGSYNGTFGNLLPYFTSYMRQVQSQVYNFLTNTASQAYGELTNGDLAMIFALGGVFQGIGFLIGM